jgi:hypothetical protein
MNRAEKEQYVIQLYKENKSTREIAGLVHMSFRDIGIIIKKKVKLAEADRERGPLEGEHKDDDIRSKSKFAQAMKLFSELDPPVEVAIALDLSADQVRAMYLEYWELSGMYRLAQIYEENRYDVHGLLELHKTVKDHRMEKQDIINVLEFVKYNQFRTLQWKAAYLSYRIDKLEREKTEAMDHLLKLKRMIGEAEETLAQKRREIAQMDQEPKPNNTCNSGSVTPHPEPDTNPHSIE